MKAHKGNRIVIGGQNIIDDLLFYISEGFSTKGTYLERLVG